MNPYHQFAADFNRLLETAKSYPLGGFPPAERPRLAVDAPKALFFAPHPDDECIAGGMALRLLREAGFNVLNVAVTQGSKKERQAARFAELEQACHYLGFGLVATGPSGLERINPKTREQDHAHWSSCVNVTAGILREHQPRVIFFPHEQDWNSTHIGTHYLVMDALRQLGPVFECYLVETEFWGAMDDPNLMVEISATDLGDMITATTFHVGEVKRNPYHLMLPAWMMDNVRRGSELVGGQGGAAPDFPFASVYRLRKWSAGNVVRTFEGGKLVARNANVGSVFA
jgi:LmbE family N-acetylglucosaminyl deacetylase